MEKQQYCLKWNNHKNNISGVFDRLRNDERFVDVTLASSDQKTIKCHRILLSAGSGWVFFAYTYVLKCVPGESGLS